MSYWESRGFFYLNRLVFNDFFIQFTLYKKTLLGVLRSFYRCVDFTRCQMFTLYQPEWTVYRLISFGGLLSLLQMNNLLCLLSLSLSIFVCPAVFLCVHSIIIHIMACLYHVQLSAWSWTDFGVLFCFLFFPQVTLILQIFWKKKKDLEHDYRTKIP